MRVDIVVDSMKVLLFLISTERDLIFTNGMRHASLSAQLKGRMNWLCALESCSLTSCPLWEAFRSLMPQPSRRLLEVHLRTSPWALQSLGEMLPLLGRSGATPKLSDRKHN